MLVMLVLLGLGEVGEWKMINMGVLSVGKCLGRGFF